MLIRAGILATCLFIVSAQKDLRKEVDLVTEPRPGQEFVHVHVSPGASKPNKHYNKGIQADANPADVTYVAPVSKTRLKSPSILSPKKAVPVELSPIAPAKDSRLLRLTSYNAQDPAAADVATLDAAHDFTAHNITRGQLLHKPEEVSVEDEGMTGVIDESAVATPEERAILDQKHKGASSYAVEEFPLELPANHKLSPGQSAADSDSDSDADRQAQTHAVPQTSQSAAQPETEQKNSNVERERHLEKKILNLETTKYEVIKLNEGEEASKDGGLEKPSKKDEDEGQFDFVDSPLGDKVLTPSGASASRTTIKKGPNGQDYEYEYVYYYYDDEEEKGTRTPGPTTITTTTGAPTRRPPPAVHHASPAAPEYQETPQRTRGKTTTESDAIVFENNFRYGNSDSTSGLGNLPVAEPASNEILPPTTGSRYQGRGRQLSTQAPATTAPIQEENLETNTRFPSRSRTPAVVTEDSYVAIQTTPQQPAPVKESKSRNSGTVKRPSVELVDSSSFHTHSNGVSAPDQEYYSPQYPQSTDFSSQPQPTAVGDDGVTTHAVTHQRGSRIRPSQSVEEEPSIGVQSVSNERAPAGSTHKQDLEEYASTPASPVESPRTRGSTFYRPFTPEGTVEVGTEAASPSSIATTAQSNTWRSLVNPATSSGTGNMPDKAALDLWAYLQKTQNEESNNIIDDDRARSEESGEEIAPIVQASPSLAPSSTPFFTPSASPSSTTTTTTEQPTSSLSTSTVAPTGRGRYRGSLTGNRNRFKVSSTEQPLPTEESTTPRRKFTPSQQRAPGHVSAYGRRGSKKTTSSEDSNASSTEASQTADEAESPKPFGSSTRGRYRGSGSRNSGGSTTTSAPAVTEARTRPTFNADRYNRRRGGTNLKATSTTAPTEADSENKDESVKKDETESESNASSTTPKPVRGRINIGSPSVRPLRPGPRISLGGRNRLPTATKPQPQAEEAETSPSPINTTSASTDESQQNNGEVHDGVSEAPVPSTTPDALTRLRNRPRLHVQTNKHTKPASPASASNRRQLVSGLLPKRKPNQPAQEAEQSEVPSPHPQENSPQQVEPNSGSTAEAENVKPVSEAAEYSSVSTSEQPSTAPPGETKLATLVGRRRNLSLNGRRPGTLINNRQNNAGEKK